MKHPHKNKKNELNGKKELEKTGQRNIFLWLVLLVTLAGLLLRLGVSWELARLNGGVNSVLTPSSLSDLATYRELGMKMASMRYEGEFYYQPFYYAVFLPVLYVLSGNSIWMVIVLQSLLGAFTVYLTGLSAGKLFGRAGGVIAAGLTAVSTPLLLYTPFHQNETLQSCHLALLFYLVICAMEKRTVRSWSWCGLVGALAILTRGNIWILVPGIALAAWITMPCGGRRWLALGSFAILLVLPQLPFAIHNSLVNKKLCGPSTAADQVLALGNTVEAPAGGRNPGLPAGAMEYPESYQDAMERVTENGRSVPAQMWDWLTASPGAFLELQFRKLLLFWDSREIPNNVSLYGEGSYSHILSIFRVGRSGVLLTFALGGMFFLAAGTIRRRSRKQGMLYYFVLAYWGATALFYILSRFRAPILPETAIFAGGFCAVFWKHWRMRDDQTRRSLLLRAGAALLGGCFLTVCAYDFYREQEQAVMRLVRPDGIRYLRLNGETIRLDHGPYTFGDWREREIADGGTLEKNFANAAGSPGMLEIQLLVLTPGRLDYWCNGMSGKKVFEKAGLETLRLPVRLTGEGNVTMRFLRQTGDFRLLYDAQRNYGRSKADGKALDGEWIVRFRESKNQKKRK